MLNRDRDLIPNSPQPLLHYPGLFANKDCTAEKVHDLYKSNGWFDPPRPRSQPDTVVNMEQGDTMDIPLWPYPDFTLPFPSS